MPTGYNRCVNCKVNAISGLDNLCITCRLLPKQQGTPVCISCGFHPYGKFHPGMCRVCKKTAWRDSEPPKPMADSGSRTQFSTGSQRDSQDGKPRRGLVSVRANLRCSIIHMLGSIKYEARNWEKGQPQSQFFESMMRHICKWQLGDTSEDHLAQARWNLDALLDQEERLAAGTPGIDGELFDLPWYHDKPVETIQSLPTRVFLDGDVKAAQAAARAFREQVEQAKRKE